MRRAIFTEPREAVELSEKALYLSWFDRLSPAAVGPRPSFTAFKAAAMAWIPRVDWLWIGRATSTAQPWRAARRTPAPIPATSDAAWVLSYRRPASPAEHGRKRRWTLFNGVRKLE